MLRWNFLYSYCFKFDLLGVAIHCVWDEWVPGECSAECGTGTRTNTREKLIEEANGGICTGEPTEILACKIKECPSKYSSLFQSNNSKFCINVSSEYMAIHKSLINSINFTQFIVNGMIGRLENALSHVGVV